MTSTSEPPPLPLPSTRPSPLGDSDGGGSKMGINFAIAALTTLFALWLTIADFAYPGNLLFQDSMSLFAAGSYLSVLFLLTLILAVLPKRIVIGSNLLILARVAMGWPLSLVIDHSLACRLISLGLLVLSVYHLASSLRRPLLDIHLRPWLKLRHSVAAILLGLGIGVLSIPVVLLGYVEAGKSIMGHYVQISWGGISLVERVFEKDGQSVHLIGMMHIGDSSFYDDLNERMRTTPSVGKRIILTEGVADAQELLPAGFKSGQTYAKLARSLGLQPQNVPSDPDLRDAEPQVPVEIPGVTFQNADIDVSDLDEEHLELLIALLEMLDVDDIAQLLTAQPPGVTGRDIELLLSDGLIGGRNEVLMENFAESAAEYTEVYIPWGAAHLPDIEARLLEQGYTQRDEVIRSIVRFWE